MTVAHTSAGSIYKQQYLKEMKLYPPHYVKILLLLGQKLVGLFEKYKVDYIMSGGTLLGAIRPPHEFIPHDYDLDFDLLVTPGNRKRFFELVKHVKAHSIECGVQAVLKLPICVKFVPKMHPQYIATYGLNNPSICNPTADVFITEPRRGGGQKVVGREWQKWYYKLGEIHPVRAFLFSGHKWCGPNKPTRILRRYYGADWRTPVFYKWPTMDAQTQ